MASIHENVYNGTAGTLITAPAAGFKSKDLGREFDASGRYVFGNYLVMNAGVGHFFSGTLMQQNAHVAPLTIAYLGLTYRWLSQ